MVAREADVEPVTTMDAPSFSRGSAFWTVKTVPRTLLLKCLVELVWRELLEDGEGAAAGTGEEDVESLCGSLDRRVKQVEIVQVRRIAANGGHIRAQFGC